MLDMERIEAEERAQGIQHVQVMPRWKAGMRRLARAGYIVSLRREIGPRDGEYWFWARASYLDEGLFGSGLRLVAEVGPFPEPDQAVQALLGEVGV